MKTKIRNTHRQSRDGDLANIAYRIVESLKDNPHFPNPSPALAVVETALQEYRDAMVNASTKDMPSVAVKNEKRIALQSLLTELRNYVTDASQGDKALLLTSGFDLARSKGELRLPPIGELTVAIGPPGEAITTVRRVPGARAYVHQYTTEPEKGESAWAGYTTTDREYRFINLQSGVRHWFRVLAIGYNQQSISTATVARIIQ